MKNIKTIISALTLILAVALSSCSPNEIVEDCMCNRYATVYSSEDPAKEIISSTYYDTVYTEYFEGYTMTSNRIEDTNTFHFPDIYDGDAWIRLDFDCTK